MKTPSETPIFLSIVTISFNQAAYLGALLDSVCPQLGDDIEFIVVDPGSTDGSRDILRARGDCISHLVLEPDEGPADGLNRGFARAKGQIGYFINSDDLMLPNAVVKLRRLWASQPIADILLGGAWLIDAKGQPTRELHAARNTQLLDFLTEQAVLVQQGMSFRMKRFRQVGGFNIANQTSWDYEFLCSMLASGSMAMRVPDRLGAFRITGDNISTGVGGTSHYNRLHEDKARIFREMVQGTPPLGKLQRAKNRLIKHLRNPEGALRRFADRIIPGRMLLRWQRDFQAK